MSLTPEAKKLLAETIRGTKQDPAKGLRARLLRALHDEADRRYRLSLLIGDAGLDEAHHRRRQRLEAWIEERTRAAKPKTKAEEKATKARLLAEAEKEAAATLINRLVVLRQLEALGLSKPAVVTGGWKSKGYREFQEFGRALCSNGTADATEGYGALLQLVFDELAIDLPGLFGDVGLTRLFAIPAATLRDVVEQLDQPALASAWTDDTTLGWVYQYWNDPDREALDDKISSGGKIGPHEIASKTQMFTERYMVEWLLQNSLGLTWLCMCKKHGWTADAEQVLPLLDARRAQWRRRREAGEVALDALMPIEGELEDQWKYFVPQPLPEDAIRSAPDSVKALKILDPAVGSGHFLVIAFGLLTALYREEARHRGAALSEKEIAESILEHNLHGIDIDPRAIQIAAAGLYLKMKTLAPNAHPRRMNLVAPVLQLGNLPKDDPAVAALRADLKRDVGIPESLTEKLLGALAGVDYLGSLLKVDAAIDDAIRVVELSFEERADRRQRQGLSGSLASAKDTLLDKLEGFLGQHSSSEDLGLRLDGEQLAAGVRFVRMARAGTYDLVVGNPPYQGLSKTEAFGYVATTYPNGKADLYAAFLQRGLELVRPGGISALLTMRGWMFLGQFAALRKKLLANHDLRAIGDFDRGAFDEVPNELLAVVVSILQRDARPEASSVALQPTRLDDNAYDRERTSRKRAATLGHVGRFEFDPRGFAVIEGEPIVYWWNRDFLSHYAKTPKLGASWKIRKGLTTCNNVRYVRRVWEVSSDPVAWLRNDGASPPSEQLHALMTRSVWAPWIDGGEGRVWFQELDTIVRWKHRGIEIATAPINRYGRGEALYFSDGVAFSMIGSDFAARRHRFRSIIGNMGASIYGPNLDSVLCQLNSAIARWTLQSLNPGVHFEKADVERFFIEPRNDASAILTVIDCAFGEHEAARETSVEFTCVGVSPWRGVQAWAQRAVDRAPGEPLPAYEPDYDPPSAEAFVSFAVGVALGRFGADGEGVLTVAPASALPAGALFVTAAGADRLDHPAAAPLHAAWREHGAAVGDGDDLRTYLRTSFFAYHKKLYDNRPIYFPLSSAKKNFVAFVSIHRWQADTLSALLADHLVPTKRRLDGELDDLRTARATGTNKRQAERRYTEVQKLLEELNDFIAKVTEIAERGPPPPDDSTPKREVDARYQMDLDDGVMVNSAALWPLLEPQWKDPRKWWKELATAKGKKDYDWAHLAARYFPSRARKKCHEDPSLAVAHQCFWELHPAKAYAWELRLQDELRPDFTIDEPGSDAARATFRAAHQREAAELVAAEHKRRARKAAKADDDSGSGPLFEDANPDRDLQQDPEDQDPDPSD
jgi:hypothetical protein